MSGPDGLNFERITSFSNDKVKFAKNLRTAKARAKEGLFIIENYREISRAVELAAAGGVDLDFFCVYFCPDLFPPDKGNEWQLLKALGKSGAKLYSLPAKVFAKIAYRDKPDGLLVLCRTFELSNWDRLKDRELFIIAEGLEKPGNLGTLLRCADAAGAALILNDNWTDVFNPNVVRASTGTLFSVPIVQASVADTVAYCRRHKIKLNAAHPDGNKNYTDEVFTGGKQAVVLGSEQYGLSDTWRENCDQLLQIPMAGLADSLNVAMAGVVMVFEARRQMGLK